ncbi:9414_t:CDS:1, partial [Acaulospora colombiana]
HWGWWFVQHLDRFTHNYGADDLNGHLERKGLERRGRKDRARNECKETSHRRGRQE